jgi:predicted DNA-binding transcriptional regulator AlpA
MKAGIYLRNVMDILELSESTVDKLVRDGYLQFTKASSKGKRVFDKSSVEEFKANPIYRALKKQTVLAYLQCETKEYERVLKKRVKQYCKQHNFKANIISQLDREYKDISQGGYRQIVNYIFDHTGIVGLLFYGRSQEIEAVKSIFKAREKAFVYSVQDLEPNEHEAGAYDLMIT